MAVNENLLAVGRKNFETMLQVLQENEMQCKNKDPDALTFNFQLDKVYIKADVDVESGLITLSALVHRFDPRDSEIGQMLAVAVCAINNTLTHGGFLLDLLPGLLTFRINYWYSDSIIGKNVPLSLYSVMTNAIVDYYDDFVQLTNGNLDIVDLLEKYI